MQARGGLPPCGMTTVPDGPRARPQWQTVPRALRSAPLTHGLAPGPSNGTIPQHARETTFSLFLGEAAPHVDCPLISMILLTTLNGQVLTSCSHILITRQPSRFSRVVTVLSRRMLRRNLPRQQAEFDFGTCPHLGQPCQKHPSTNTAKDNFGNMKSG